MADPLTRWRARCERAIRTGEGLPVRGLFRRRPDDRAMRTIARILQDAAGATEPNKVLDVIRYWQTRALLNRARLYVGFCELAERWLREELAAEEETSRG